MSGVIVELVSAALGEVTVIEVEGREAMDALASWQVRVFADHDIDPEAALGAPATLVFVDPAEQTERQIGLIVTGVAGEIERGRERVYALALSDPPWLLTQRGGYRVFVEKTTEQIVTEVLRDAGVPAAALEPRLAGSYPVRLHCAAYDEGEWAFIERLLADEGISYWFETREGGEHRVVFGDSPGSHEGIAGGAALSYVGPRGALSSGARGISALSWEEQVTHDRALVRDLDIRHPDTYLDGQAGEGDLVYFEYPALIPSAEAARARAERRLEQLQRDRVEVRAETDCVRVQPGRVLEIQGAGEEMFDQRMLVVEVRHRYARPLRDGGKSTPYGNHASLRPTQRAEGGASAHHRPAPPRRPAIEHVDSALVTGPPGEEIHVDELGRVRIRFVWDPLGPKDDRASHWTRCLQYPLGAAMFLPRLGWEVSVGYLDGAPDRPFVLGRVYNATAVAPHALPAASATTSFQSWTTPRSGMTQGITMSDDAGQQQMALHAARDMSVKVGGSRTTSIAGDEDHSVGLGLTANVLGARSVSVGAMQTIDVGKELLLTVDGSNSEVIAAAEVINVKGNRGLAAGASCIELVGGAYGLLCNQSNVRVNGACSRVTAGSKTILAGLGVTEAIAGGRVYVCLSNRTFNCGSYSESITGGKRSKSGAVQEKGVAIGTTASSGKVKAATASVRAAGTVTLSAPIVNIEVSGSLTAGALTISGGTVKTTSGGLVVKGNTNKTRGGEVGS